jgi:cytochrome c oxidase subunit I+III
LPLVAAFLLMVVFAAELYNAHVVAIAAGLGMTVSIVAWMWPPANERERCLDDAGRRTIHGLPIYLSGPVAPGWWGMLFTILVLAVGSACLVFSYGYLAVRAPEWPPSDTPRPGLVLPALELLVLLGVAGGWLWARHSVRRDGRVGLLVGSSGAVGLGLLGLVLQGIEFTGWGWTPDVNAYTSAVGTLVGLQSTYVLLGLLMAGVTALQAWLGYFNAWRYLAVENVANFWIFVAIHYAVLIGVVYLPWGH